MYWWVERGSLDLKTIVNSLRESGKFTDAEVEKALNDMLEAQTHIGIICCEYCGKRILSIMDKYNNDKWWPYLGNQARKPNTYSYSPAIRAFRKRDGCENGVWANDLANLHARIHTVPVRDYSLICSGNSLKWLCNECFQKTYQRVKVFRNHENPNAARWSQRVDHIEVSVLYEKGETVETVLRDCGINPNNVEW